MEEVKKITISGIGGVGKGTTASMLAEKLGYKTLSGGDFFRQMAEENNMTLYEFDQFVKENTEYDRRLDKMQETYGKENINFVLESRIGWYFVPDSIKVKLVCEEEERLKRVLARDGGNIEDVKKNEKERLDSVHQRYKELYDIEDFSRDENFDLIVDTTENNPEEVVEIILRFLETASKERADAEKENKNI